MLCRRCNDQCGGSLYGPSNSSSPVCRRCMEWEYDQQRINDLSQQLKTRLEPRGDGPTYNPDPSNGEHEAWKQVEALEIERDQLREQLATAKAKGAAGELERQADAIAEGPSDEWSTWRIHDFLRDAAAAIRKGIK